MRATARLATVPCVVALTLVAACGTGGGPESKNRRTTIQIKGSDTMVNLVQAWAEEYKKTVPTVEVEVSGGGSGVGIAALTKGTIAIATASRNMKPAEIEEARRNTGKTPVEFVVGYDALAVFVHRDNPLDTITLQNLAQIYAEDGSVTTWSALGAKIPGTRHDRILRVSRQNSSGTYEFFRTRVLNRRDFKLGSCDMNGSKEVVELVASARTAIGYSGMGYATPEVKMLKVAASDADTACSPTVANVQRKAYPLARSLLMYTLGEPEGAVKEFITWTLSPRGQEIVQECGYVPVAATEKGTR